MASESASPDDCMDMDAAGLGLPPVPAPQETDVADGIAASMVQEVPQGGTSAPTIRALNGDDPPDPVWQVVDHGRDSGGPQLHDDQLGPPCFPLEFDDSLAKRVENEGRNLSDHARNNRSTVHSTMGPSVANAAAVVSMVDLAEEGRVSSPGTGPPMSSHVEAATAAAGLNPPSGLSTFIAEAYMVEDSGETPG
ncbi:hypothetical protein THAOC_29067, partial [Thalassiosira oceanica]